MYCLSPGLLPVGVGCGKWFEDSGDTTAILRICFFVLACGAIESRNLAIFLTPECLDGLRRNTAGGGVNLNDICTVVFVRSLGSPILLSALQRHCRSLPCGAQARRDGSRSQSGAGDG